MDHLQSSYEVPPHSRYLDFCDEFTSQQKNELVRSFCALFKPTWFGFEKQKNIMITHLNDFLTTETFFTTQEYEKYVFRAIGDVLAHCYAVQEASPAMYKTLFLLFEKQEYLRDKHWIDLALNQEKLDFFLSQSMSREELLATGLTRKEIEVFTAYFIVWDDIGIDAFAGAKRVSDGVMLNSFTKAPDFFVLN